jgi:predicted amidohydrolase YtcJ
MVGRVAGVAVIALVTSVLGSCQGGEMANADLILTNGMVWTGVEGEAPAEAVAVAGRRIVAVGSVGEVESWRGPTTRVIDLDGRLATPGIIDAHTHFVQGGFQLSSVDLRDADSPEEFVRRIGEFAAGLPEGVWVTGGDWDHEAWGGELPRAAWIDAAVPDRPVFVSRLDGHMAVANSRALALAGVTAETPDPEGGAIVRDPGTGAPQGVLKDEAMSLVFSVIPRPTEEELDGAVRAAAAHALSLGVTQVHDMGTWDHLESYRRAQARGELPLRVYSVVPMATLERLSDFVAREGRGDERLWWGGLKAFVDGSLGSTTAWFYEPYADEPGTSGLLTTDTTRLRQDILRADREGLHAIVHAIGDRANDWLLDVYAEARALNGDWDRRFRVEHAQHLSPAAIGRFGAEGVIPSMQPYHAIDDGRWAEKRIGADRLGTTYAFRSLLDAEANIAFGSDWTVAPLSPLLGVYAAATRRTLDGANPDGWVPAQRITVEEALTAYTVGAAFAGYAEDRVGTLQPGMLADLAVFDRNLLAVDRVEIETAGVDLTIVDGRIVFEREGAGVAGDR